MSPIWRTFCFFMVVLWLFVHVASFLDDFFSQKIKQYPLLFAPVLTKKIPAGGNWSLPPNIKVGQFVGDDWVPHTAVGILPALFHRWSTTCLLHKKKNPYTVPHCTSVPYTTAPLHCPVLYRTVLLYYIHCSVLHNNTSAHVTWLPPEQALTTCVTCVPLFDLRHPRDFTSPTSRTGTLYIYIFYGKRLTIIDLFKGLWLVGTHFQR